jgi:hypothetical protein
MIMGLKFMQEDAVSEYSVTPTGSDEFSMDDKKENAYPKHKTSRKLTIKDRKARLRVNLLLADIRQKTMEIKEKMRQSQFLVDLHNIPCREMMNLFGAQLSPGEIRWARARPKTIKRKLQEHVSCQEAQGPTSGSQHSLKFFMATLLMDPKYSHAEQYRIVTDNAKASGSLELLKRQRKTDARWESGSPRSSQTPLKRFSRKQRRVAAKGA